MRLINNYWSYQLNYYIHEQWLTMSGIKNSSPPFVTILHLGFSSYRRWSPRANDSPAALSSRKGERESCAARWGVGYTTNHSLCELRLMRLWLVTAEQLLLLKFSWKIEVWKCGSWFSGCMQLCSGVRYRFKGFIWGPILGPWRHGVQTRNSSPMNGAPSLDG